VNYQPKRQQSGECSEKEWSLIGAGYVPSNTVDYKSRLGTVKRGSRLTTAPEEY